MKNIKYVYKFLLAIPLVFMVGCVGTDDYNDVLSNQYTQQSTVFIETDDASEITRTVPGNQAQPIEVGINNAQSGDITVSFNVTKDGGAAVEGVDYSVEDATIFASDVTGSSEVTFFAAGIYIVTVGNSSDGSLIAVDNKATFNVPPAVTVSISWGDDYYDYDLYLVKGNQDLNGEVLANTFGVTAFETFEVYPPEGFSSVFIDDYWGDNASIDVVMFVEIDGELTVYDVVMDMDKFVLVIETTFDAEGNLVYDITAL
ncbi:MAG: hypothetical protein ACI83H_000277 [Glaciecola sp.]|jgi:hypothetical protein